ncbi:MAG: MMPL family transporter [Candidatus Thalassarchaeum sp.]
MTQSALSRFGRQMHSSRRTVFAAAFASLIISLLLISQGNSFIDGNSPPPTIEAGRALDLVDDELPVTSANSVTFIFSHDEMLWIDDEYQQAVSLALAKLSELDIEILSISTAYDAAEDPIHLTSHVSRDGHTTAAYVRIGGTDDEISVSYDNIITAADNDVLDVLVTGSLVINTDFDNALKNDQVRAEIIGIPLSLVILLFVFGTFTAAMLPMVIALLMITLATATSFWMSDWWFFGLSQYSISMISLIGIAVSIDYSLFMISRFREELDAGAGVEDAIAKMMDTAGRAVLFSGATVAISLCSLFYFTATHMPAMAMGGFLAVLASLIYSLTVLPAMLSYIGPKIDSLKVPLPGANTKTQFWEKFSSTVMKRPISWLAPAMILLLLLGSPFLRVELNAGGIEALPPDFESRMGYEVLVDEFPAYTASTIPLVVVFEEEQPDWKSISENLAAVCDGIRETAGVISIEHPLCYPNLFDMAIEEWPEDVQSSWYNTVSESVAMINVATEYSSGTERAEQLIADLRVHTGTSSEEILVGGWTSYEVDTKNHLSERIPTVVAFVVLVTMILIWLQVHSIIVPIKAVLMNVLSVSASFGLVVLVFQDGLLAETLNFTPQPLDLIVPPLVFGIAFGLSMDYEVLMLSRIHEAWVETGDNTKAVAKGLQASGSLITGAAGIMIAVFSGFIFADVLIIKSMGLALAAAVFIDATIVRAVVVPSAMRLMGRANWWAPSFLSNSEE